MTDLTKYTHGEEQYYVAKEVMKLLGFSTTNFSKTLKFITVKYKISFIDFQGEKVPEQNWTETLITRGGVRELISRAKKASEENLEIFRTHGFEIQKKPLTLVECMQNKPRQLTRYFSETDDVERGENYYFIGYEVTTLLGYKKPIRTITTHVDKENQLLFKDFKGEKVPNIHGKTVLINRKGACQLLVKTRMLLTSDVLCIFRECGIETLNKKSLTKEQQTLSPIINLLKIYKPQEQYPVGKYRLDLYFPEYRIIVECDENNHSGRNPVYELEREEFVNNALGLSTDNWIRYNPDARDFDLKRTIRIIMAKIERIKEARIEAREAELKEKMSNMEETESYLKMCCTCREEKDISFFGKNKRRSDGYELRCKSCRSIHYRRCQEAKKIKTIVVPDEKLCPQCKITKKKEFFWNSQSRKDGLYNICKECSKAEEKKVMNIKKVVPKSKICSNCKEERLSSEFYARKKSFDGLTGQCNICLRKKNVERNAKNHDGCQKCRSCKERKSLKEFKMMKKGLAKICNECDQKPIPESKICTGCEVKLPISMFFKNRKTRDGYLTRCKKCAK